MDNGFAPAWVHRVRPTPGLRVVNALSRQRIKTQHTRGAGGSLQSLNESIRVTSQSFFVDESGDHNWAGASRTIVEPNIVEVQERRVLLDRLVVDQRRSVELLRDCSVETIDKSCHCPGLFVHYVEASAQTCPSFLQTWYGKWKGGVDADDAIAAEALLEQRWDLAGDECDKTIRHRVIRLRCRNERHAFESWRRMSLECVRGDHTKG